MHLSRHLLISISSARQDDLRVVFELTDAKIVQIAIDWQTRQSAHDSVGGVVKAGALLGRDGAALHENNKRFLDNYGPGALLYIQARILDESSFL